ncbi:hypothetical protein, partial [Vibrio sp. M260112]|uniref:hypothetical protein n=1 Tax=Vibrio sp. M260112 TaxID=3020895 RepID=UPI002F3FAB08
TYITTGDFDDSLQAGIIGGLSAGITYGVAHGATGGTSPFGAALPLAHGVVQGGIHELQGGSFKQGFISGVIGKLGGGIVHANVQTQTLQAGGMIIVSGIAAAASGANSRDAMMRSAVSVITVYLYNEMGWVTYRGQRMYVDKDTFQKNAANAYLAEEAGQPMSDYLETTEKEAATALSITSIGVTIINPLTGGTMATAAWGLDSSWSNFIGMIIGPMGKGVGVVDDALYYGSPVFKETVDNVGTVNDAVSVGCNTVMTCE